jgi:hypothetical protein
MGENSFELSITHFLASHSLFNVELLRPYFPPLLDTLEVADHLGPIKLNPDCDEKTIVNQIIYIEMRGSLQ